MSRGKSIALYGDSGSGKTTLAGEHARSRFKQTGKPARLHTSDRGGYDSVGPEVRAGIIIPNELGPTDNPWIWIDDAAQGKPDGEFSLEIFDGGTSQSEALLSACAHSPWQIGQRPVQKFAVAKGDFPMMVPTNTDAHYGVVQNFMLDTIWKSTWLTRLNRDVIWTFTVYRGEEENSTPILGPKLAGKALTALVPKWFNYTFMLESIPVEGEAPRHVLYTAEHTALSGLGHSFGNSRYPLGVSPLPASIEPASLVEVFKLIEAGQKEADEKLAAEMKGN